MRILINISNICHYQHYRSKWT